MQRQPRQSLWCPSLKPCRTNALNARFLGDHVYFTPNGRHWRKRSCTTVCPAVAGDLELVRAVQSLGHDA